MFSDDLTWNKHVDMVRAKCSKSSGFIRRTVKTRNKDVLLKLFSSVGLFWNTQHRFGYQ